MIKENFITNLKDLVKQKGFSLAKSRQLLYKTTRNFQNQFRKLIWKHRCKITVETDKILGITIRDKKEVHEIRKTK